MPKIGPKHPVKNFTESVCPGWGLQGLPNPLIGEIFLALVKDLTYTKATAEFLSCQLVCKKFQRALQEDPRPLLALLNKLVVIPFFKKGPPLSLVRAIRTATEKDRRLVSDYYKDHLAKTFVETKSLEATLPYLEGLLQEDRERITLLNFSLIKQKPSEDTLKRFIILLPNLKEVVIPSSLTYPTALFSSLGAHAPKLTTLLLQAGVDKYLSQLLAHCKKISSLKINMGVDLEGPTFIKLLTLPLHSLHISGVCPISLKTTKNHPWPSLRKLSLMSENFKDEDVAVMIEKNRQLISLSLCLSGCKEEGVKMVLASSLPLHTLDLSHLPVQDRHFLGICKSLQFSLQRLILCHCKELTTEGIKNALSALPNLRYLDLRYCDKVDRNKIALQLERRRIFFQF